MKPLRIFYPGMKNSAMRARVRELMEIVRLSPAEAYMLRYPHEFSGGQRQRLGIARAIALSPMFIVADEPVSALDVSIRGQILNLFNELKKKLSLSYLFITHDMSVVRSIADRVAVMYLGKIVELAEADSFFAEARHPYSQAILSATPIADPELSRKRVVIDLKGELPSPVNVPTGCRFCTRCQHATQECRELEPELTDLGGGHYCACLRRARGEI
jgi:oligopeptide/dipeptide ABC transporter ATP-binding protein